MMKEHVKIDTKEFEIPETVFIRDIETRVFQSIILHCLGKIKGVGLLEGNLIDTLLGREVERVKGIHVEQDSKTRFVNIKVEILVRYGVSIPRKAEEIQSKIIEEITNYTGLHVGCVHVIFKGLIPIPQEGEKEGSCPSFFPVEAQEYSDKF